MVINLYNLIAHRGKNSYKYGENTKESIINALNKPYISGIEIDIRMTKDNKIVVLHDKTINRTSNGHGLVSKTTYSKLKKYNFGTKTHPSKISLLKDILKIVPNNKILLIEIKCELCNENKFIKNLLKTLKPFKNKNIHIMSFNNSIINKIKKKEPNLKCGILISTLINSTHIKDNTDFIAISSYSINKIKNYQKPIFIWAINNKKTYQELQKQHTEKIYYIVDFPYKYL